MTPFRRSTFRKGAPPLRDVVHCEWIKNITILNIIIPWMFLHLQFTLNIILLDSGTVPAPPTSKWSRSGPVEIGPTVTPTLLVF